MLNDFQLCWKSKKREKFH